MQLFHKTEFPDFIIKSTLFVSLTAILLLTPFAFISLLHQRFLLSILILAVIIVCSINIICGLKNHYHNLFNILGTITLTITSGIALYQLGVVASYWAIIAVLSFYFILPQKQAWIMNLLFVIFVTPIAWNVLDPNIVIRFFAVLIGTSIFAFTSTYEIYKQYDLLKEQSVTDSLTGLYNRSLLQTSLENTIHQHQRSNIDMALLMIDIDHFKEINDQFGHDIGDSVLQETGKFLKESFRSSDMVFRIGGEEFLAVLYNTDKVNTINIAEKLRKEFEQLPLIPNKPVTISIGVADLQKDMDWKQWMKQGDRNLYQAKANGRNQVVA